MKKKITTTNDPRDFLRLMGTPYQVTHAGSASKFETDETTYIFREATGIETKDLFIIQMALRDIDKAIKGDSVRVPGYNNQAFPDADKFPGNVAEEIKASDIQYSHFDLTKGIGRHTGVIEVDLNSAYWALAKNLGYISKRTYDRGKTVSKSARLAALGAAAKTSYLFDFDGEKEIFRNKITRPTAPAFFHLCYELGKIMRDIYNEYSPFIYGWYVDALFLDQVAQWDILEMIKRVGHEAKIRPLESIILYSDTAKAIHEDGTVKKYNRQSHAQRVGLQIYQRERIERKMEEIRERKF